MVGPALLVGFMPNDEKVSTLSRDSSCPERERNCPHPSKHMQGCPLLRDRTQVTCRTTGTFRDKWAVPGDLDLGGSGLPVQLFLGIFCWHPSPRWLPMGNLHLYQWLPGVGGYYFALNLALVCPIDFQPIPFLPASSSEGCPQPQVVPNNNPSS